MRRVRSAHPTKTPGTAARDLAVQAEVKSGNDVFYKVAAQYFGGRVVPYAFKLSALVNRCERGEDDHVRERSGEV